MSGRAKQRFTSTVYLRNYTGLKLNKWQYKKQKGEIEFPVYRISKNGIRPDTRETNRYCLCMHEHAHCDMTVAMAHNILMVGVLPLSFHLIYVHYSGPA